uniref:C2 domain-containing protein n=1 Tax=Kwoniella dejecticola CBS 10117 TaxID=1296121 RepID=A0A1A5ZZB6_9TREE|nr:uncharacterized protein I303_06717 [Kwoniella dejecticola CBS 10117]OBR83158.1 hypothetical protein I303_06717 [Kwoniella dejecticola CBS 10117]
MSSAEPPRLPPRRPAPSVPAEADGENAMPVSTPPALQSRSTGTIAPSQTDKTLHEDAESTRASAVQSNTVALPPPLPPRVPSVSRPVPQPILVHQEQSQNATPNEPSIEENVTSERPLTDSRYTASQPPDTSVTVAITPATPPDSENGSSPTSPTAPSFGQSVEEMRTPLPSSPPTLVPADSTRDTFTTPSGPDVTAETPAPPPLPPRKAQPPQLPPRRSMSANVALSTVPSVGPWVWMISMISLAYLRVSLVTLVILGLGGYIGMKRLEEKAEVLLKEQEPEDAGPGSINDKQAVEWVNHALYALFPLISEDVLIPFVDLMEDALAGQVPPVVTSVRMTSPALGSQPLLLTSLKPISDEQWFSSLSVPTPTKPLKASGSLKLPMKGRNAHKREGSAVSFASPSTVDMNRSPSASSAKSASGFDTDEMAKEAGRRRKRDRILQKVSRKRPPMSDGNKIKQDQNTNPPEFSERIDSTQQASDGARRQGGQDDDEVDGDDPNAGQYVNYQVGFEYRRTRDAEKKGRGLHCLAYFGWGIKGVAGSEIPVYIDVISIKGTVNLRLLLSATPPFLRTGTFSFPRLPEYDVSAHPLKKGAFNAMELPGMKQYVKQSITEVASSFVSPQSYTIDLDRLLLGEESALRTHNIGVLRIIIHSAEGLPKVDTMGSCDPYISIGFSKYHKPLFSTRTIRDTRDPRWDEEAFIPVSSDAIEAGERLRIRACDSDRFSADDAMGVVEVDVAELVDTHSDKLHHRRDEFQADRPGMKCSGSLNWSIQFHGLWQMSEEEIKSRVKESKVLDGKEGINPPAMEKVPVWMEILSRIIDKNEEKWYVNREKKRKETLAWFTGEKERDSLEVQGKPDENLRSGILQFHIHQCIDLEVEPLSGTYSSHTASKLSAAGGKPALEDLTDRTPIENPEPPSSYCEVHLNDKLVYRTRTKQVTPLPYFNAVSERFVKDWNHSKITFVVRDERNREHDPILGLVVVPLKEAFKTRSQFTRWFPLVGGLGWGRIRISLLWKPLDMSIPRGPSEYEVATFRLKSLSFNSLGVVEKGLSVLLSTDSDRYELNTSSQETSSSATPTSARTSLERLQRSSLSSPSKSSLVADEELDIEFDLSSKQIRLAIMYRHSCSLVITLLHRSSVLKKKRIMGMGVVRLSKMNDGLSESKIGIWATEDVEKVIRLQELLDYEENGDDNHHGNDHLTSPPLESKPSFRRRISERRSWPASNTSLQRNRASSISSVNSSRTNLSIPSSISNGSIPLLGYANLQFKLIPGVSRTHRKVAKRNMRFAKVYEVWESEKEIKMGWNNMQEGERLKDDGDESESSGDAGENGEERELTKGGMSDSEDELDKKISERRAHSHALHKRHKGIFQLKIARTGRYVKDKLSAKVYSAAHSGGNKDQGRARGTDLEVEREGISNL